MTWEWIVIGVLAVAGAIDAAYVLRVAAAPPQVVSRIADGESCSMEDPAVCKTLFTSSRAYVLPGVSNSAMGLIYYVVVEGSVWLQPLPRWWLLLVLLAATAAVGLSVVLFVSLRRRNLVCVPCFIGHGINLLIWGLLLSQC